jgi:hypothetical protein
MQRSTTLEYLTALCGLALGLLVAYLFAIKSEIWLANMLFYWVPQAAVMLLFCMYKPPRPAFFSGLSLALTAYLALFGWWLFSRQQPESMAWLGYLFSLPGAVVGGLLAVSWLAKNQGRGMAAAMSLAAASAGLGIAVNQLLVCSTVMYCWGK